MLEKQRQREREAEENHARRRQLALGSGSSPGLKPSTTAWRPTRRTEGEVMGRSLDGDASKSRPPRTNSSTADGSPSRDRIPARSDGSPRTDPKTSPAPSAGRYVPPARRAAQ